MVQRKVRIVLLPSAKFDLKEIVEYIAAESPRYALIERNRILSVIKKLSGNQLIGKVFEYNSVELRQLIFKHYLIIYRIKSTNLVEILTSIS